jgi:hypothetical protein
MPKEPTFAEVAWTAEDLQTLRPNWSDEQCEEWLDRNEDYIQTRLIELGWEVMESLLSGDE